MTRIALMRHYPTEWNAEARLQGRADFVLLRDLRPDAERAARLSAAANPWLQIVLDRRKTN